MGCITSKASKDGNVEENKKYSWNHREKVDLKEYTIENEVGSLVVKKPGSVNGCQFIVQNCEKAILCIFDYLDSATVDDCIDCTIFLGPTKGSIFLRNCKDCRIMCASQQLRVRDSKCLQISLLCLTKPAIESSEVITFSCFSFYYTQLYDQFKAIGLSIFNNSWNQIYDFSASDGEQHWQLLDSSIKVEDIFRPFLKVKDPEIFLDPILSVVPRTLGFNPDPNLQMCLVIFFTDGNREKKAKAFIREMYQRKHPLISSKEFCMKEVEASNIFGTDSYNSVISRGPVIALQHCGQDAIKNSQEVAKSIALETGSTGLVYVSSHPETALQQIRLIFNPIDT